MRLAYQLEPELDLYVLHVVAAAVDLGFLGRMKFANRVKAARIWFAHAK
jgi:hypothetical protein